ncbi:MAG: relaxase/mobilization nuclease domain-containing protein [Clostridia bacterium]|nr:relaxase/mobilization nuclease domain-containing protein [Clostridia bacterium]
MATTGFWPVKGGINRVLDYVSNSEKTANPEYDAELQNAIAYAANPSKTEKQLFVSALNCPHQQAYEWMMATKRRYGKLGGNTAYHGYQSFAAGELTAEEAHAIGVETARRMWGDEYEVLITTHLNTNNLHNHFVINSVSFRTGRKYENHKRDHLKLREISDSICLEHGLSIIENHSGIRNTFAEQRAHESGILTMKEMLESDMRACIDLACDVPHFYSLMENLGYEVSFRSKYPSFLPIGAKRPLRLKKNGKSMTDADIEAMLDESFERQRDEIIIPAWKPQFVPYEKQHGFRALVLHWMYILGIIGQGKQTYYKVDRGELKKFERYKRQQAFLDKYEIDTEAQLIDHKSALIEKQAALTEKRDALRKEQRRTGEKNPEIGEITAELYRIRSELKLCDDIEADIPRIEAIIEEGIKRENKELEGEIYTDFYKTQER